MADDDFMVYTVTFLKLGGIYPVQSELSRTKRWLMYVWRIIIGLALLFMAILSAVNIAKKRSVNFESAVESIVFFGFSIITITRTIYMITFGSKGFSIIQEMKLLFKEETSTGLREKSLKTAVAFANRLTFFWAILGTLSSQCLIFTRLIFNGEPERIFPLPLWFPEGWKASPFYEHIIVYQSFMAEINAIIVVAVDSFVVTTILYVCAQFDMLGWECKCLLYKVLKRRAQKKILLLRTVGEDDVVLDETVSLRQIDEMLLGSKQVKADMLNGLNNIITFHQFLLDFCGRFNAIASPIFLLYFIVALVTLMFISVTIITTSDLTCLGVYVLYFTCVSFTLFLPCYFGNLLTTQAEKFFQDLNDSPWYVCDETFKKSLKLMQLRARSPLTLTIGKFGELSLRVFLSVMQSTTSYALVFRRLMEEKY